MVARNGKSMIKLVRLPILRPLLVKREILWWLENSKILKDLYSWVARPPSHTNPEIFRTFKRS